MKYDAEAIEQKWQRWWQEKQSFLTPVESGGPSAFVKVAPPFTSGDVHIGHVRSYSIADAHARFRRARGEDVLFAVGFDAFGLPAEREALERGLRPEEWIEANADRMRNQLERLGLSFDWTRLFVTSRPSIYRWSQWLFLTLLEAGLVDRREALTDWCAHCETALSRQQAMDGCCWRCDGSTTLREQFHWYLRLSAYNDENHRRLEHQASEWNPQAVAGQRSQLGRVEGIELDAEPLGADPFPVFTQHVDDVASSAFIAIAPRHPLVARWLDGAAARFTKADLIELGRRKRGLPVDSGLRAQVPGVAELLPVLITPSVEERFGLTAVLGIPEADQIDAELAAGLPSDLGSLRIKAARRPLISRPAVRYRAADFPISRPRPWGTPVPVVHCRECGVVPVSKADLPVLLPLRPEGPGLVPRLDAVAEFVDCACPVCAGKARRDVTTLDCHFDALWMYAVFAVAPEAREADLFENSELRRWLPMAECIQGADTSGFILNERMVAKALRDLGVWEFMKEGEPLGRVVQHGMVQAQGRKMSKHLKNGIDPGQLVEEVGADALRFALLFAAAPAKEINWDPAVLRYSRSFLDRLWAFVTVRVAGCFSPDAIEVPVFERSTALRRRLALWVETALTRTTQNLEKLEMHRATRNVIKLLDQIESFERQQSRKGELCGRDEDAVVASLLVLIHLLGPIAPHLAEELWSMTGGSTTLEESPWPTSEMFLGGRDVAVTLIR